MNGLTQTTTSKILALKEPTEFEVLKIIDGAFEEHVKPHTDESENCHKLVNETNERAAAEVKKATDALSEKQNEIIELREHLKESRANVANAASQIAELQAENERVATESKQAHARNDELVSEHLELKEEISLLRATFEPAKDTAGPNADTA